MLLSKGIKMEVGDSASTDGKETIYLPHAMRRYLAWDEIDFVRYLVHHEHAHIKHSQNKCEVISSSGAYCHQMFGFVINLLEDLRIEQLEINSSKGIYGVYERGRSISTDMWVKYVDGLDEEKMDVHTCLCHLIYSGCINPEFREDDSVLNHGGLMEYLHMKFQLAGVYDKVDRIRDAVDEFPYTSSLSELAKLICRLLGSGDNLPEEDRPPEQSLGLDEEGAPTSQQVELGDKAAQEAYRDQHQERWSRGLVEKMLEEELCDDSLPQDKRVTEDNLNRTPHGMYLSFGGEQESSPDESEARKNYAWAEWAAGMAGQVVDRLRGQERASLSRPKQSGVRIAQRNAVPFLKGLTSDLLRRKKKAPRNGTAVVFCIDDSGSMNGAYSLNAWRAAGMLAIACDRAKIKSMVIRYSNDTKVEKLFAQPAGVLRNKLSIGFGGGTNASRAIKTSLAHIRGRSEDRRVVFFLSDGCTDDCRHILRDVSAEGIEFIPILFGESAAHRTLRGREWDVPGKIIIPDPEKVSLGPILVDRLAATL
ncbi:MAG: hypothetical protein Unbinned3138contig1001_2 [Prokaryotic dsDNA virus sp.]|nr:MAG: hypothetical protein Unbinned3138contig1001_2 [Prokaryotic dsDNA virus sp.]|tara:strand:+ start:1082 stop:2686 length:1605 start_codon:yes stop_codon:yes gene_type:complete